MTTTELIKLLQQPEKGASDRSREITIYTYNEEDMSITLMNETDLIEVLSTGDGCAGAEIALVISKNK